MKLTLPLGAAWPILLVVGAFLSTELWGPLIYQFGADETAFVTEIRPTAFCLRSWDFDDCYEVRYVFLARNKRSIEASATIVDTFGSPRLPVAGQPLTVRYVQMLPLLNTPRDWAFRWESVIGGAVGIGMVAVAGILAVGYVYFWFFGNSKEH